MGSSEKMRATDALFEPTSRAFSEPLRVDGASNIYTFANQDDQKRLGRALLLRVMPHWKSSSSVPTNGGSRNFALQRVAAFVSRMGDLPTATAILELWGATTPCDNRHAQVLDLLADALMRAGRFEDALLCHAAISKNSGMGGVLVWKAPTLRRHWSHYVRRADRTAIVTARATEKEN